MADARYRIGFDIGGTFTDFILLDTASAEIRLHKCLTTPHDPSAGALAGLAELVAGAGLGLAEIGDIVHGTTLVTNALIERRGARLGLITTRGFRDILEMGTEQRYDIYDLFLQFPAPLVPRRHRLEVAERMDRDGNALLPLDAAEIQAAAQRLVSEGVEAIAVCFLHAYRNPAHELQAAAVIRAAFPHVALSLSSEVVGELWEYQRCVTTCANAYVQPLVGRYVGTLERELRARGFRGALHLMHSAGGLLSPEAARAYPIRLLESGPAGGGLATAFFGAAAGMAGLLSRTRRAYLREVEARAEQAERLRAGARKVLGLGLSTYVEVTAVGSPTEHAAVQLESGGTLQVKVGTMSSGQGHATTYAQMISDWLGLPPDPDDIWRSTLAPSASSVMRLKDR